MSADTVVAATPAPSTVRPAGRSPGTVIAALTAVRAARSGCVWGAVFGVYVISSALGYAATYTTPAARAQLASTFGANVGFNALIGPAHQIGTVAGFTSWRSLGTLSVIGGVWGLLTGTRLLRGEEDAGRWEALLAGHTTRRGATVQALAGLAAGLVTLWAVTAVMAVAVGRAGSVRIGAGDALYLSCRARRGRRGLPRRRRPGLPAGADPTPGRRLRGRRPRGVLRPADGRRFRHRPGVAALAVATGMDRGTAAPHRPEAGDAGPDHRSRAGAGRHRQSTWPAPGTSAAARSPTGPTPSPTPGCCRARRASRSD